jgi:hypothetical protein
MDQRLIGQAAVDHSLFREQSYHALTRQDTAQSAGLGTYRTQSTQSQSGGPVAAPAII